MTDDFSELVDAAGSGDANASGRIFTLLYDELRRCAHRQLGGANRTLSTTALVHETWLRLLLQRLRLKVGNISWRRRSRDAPVGRPVARSVPKGAASVFVTLDEGRVDGANGVEVLALDRA